MEGLMTQILGILTCISSLVYIALGLPLQIKENYNRKSTEGLGQFMIWTLLGVTIARVMYSVAIKDRFIFTSNIFIIPLAAIMLIQFRIYRPQRQLVHRLYFSHSHDMDYRSLYYYLRMSNLNRQFALDLPHEESDEPFMTKERLKIYSAIIAEVSSRATGQGIELGQANMANVPIICVYQKGAKPAGSLKTISRHFYEYDGPEDMIRQIHIGLRELGLA